MFWGKNENWLKMLKKDVKLIKNDLKSVSNGKKVV